MMSTRELLRSVGLVLLCVVGTTAAAQQPPAQTPDAAKTLAELQALETAVESAFQRADVAYLKDVLAEDFQFWISSGKPLAKAAVLTSYGQAGRFPRRELTAVNIEVHGDTALSNGRMEVHSTVPRDYVVCYIRLYQRRGDRWQLVSHRTFRERDGFAETCAPVDRTPGTPNAGPASAGRAGTPDSTPARPAGRP